MELSKELIKSFAKITNDKSSEKKDSFVYGTARKSGTNLYVKFDGSDIYTPVSSVVDVENENRVMVMIKNHQATITSNITSPAVNNTNFSDFKGSTVQELNLSKANIVELSGNLANYQKVVTQDLSAQSGRIDVLSGNFANYQEIVAKDLTAQSGRIDTLSGDLANYKEIVTQDLSAQMGNITKLYGDFADYKRIIADDLSAQTARIDTLSGDLANYKNIVTQDLTAQTGRIDTLSGDYADFKTLTAQEIAATNARIDNINAGTVTTEYLEANYASIDLANVETASVGELLARTGVLTDMTVVNGYVTGQLNGVRINADVITAGTLSVDRLLVTGEDSIVYQINVASSGLSMTELADEKYQKYLNGTDIVAASITGDRIAGNTITGNHIIANSIHGDRILAGSITGDRIAANAITAREINVNDLFAKNIMSTGMIVAQDMSSSSQAQKEFWKALNEVFGVNDILMLNDTVSTISLNNGNKLAISPKKIELKSEDGSRIYEINFPFIGNDGVGLGDIEIKTGTKTEQCAMASFKFAYEYVNINGRPAIQREKVLAKFKMSYDGSIVSTGGKIGGWSINDTELSNTNSHGNIVKLSNGTNASQDVLTVRTGAGTASSPYKYPVTIRADGKVNFSNAEITGDITSTRMTAYYGISMKTYNGVVGKLFSTGESVDAQTDIFFNMDGVFTQLNLRVPHVSASGDIQAIGSLYSTKLYTGSIKLSAQYPYIDFHFNNSTEDYTSRIWESSYKNININGVDFRSSTVYSANWFRSIGNTGWINETRGGGWWMTDDTWIRSFGGKNIYHDVGIMRTDGTLQVGGNGTYFNANSAGASFGVNLTLGSHNLIFNNTYGIQSGGHWVIRQYTTSADNKTVCIGCGNASQPLRLFTTNSRVWLHNGNSYFAITSGSDRRLKKDFSEITEAYEKMYMDVDVSAFRYILDDGAIHYGFMAQDVEAALRKNSLPTDSNLYGVCAAENNEAAVIHDTNVYHVNYLEWVPLNKHMITKTIRRLDMLEADTEITFNMLSSKTDSAEHRLAEITEELARMQAENIMIKTELEQLKQQWASVA